MSREWTPADQAAWEEMQALTAHVGSLLRCAARTDPNIDEVLAQAARELDRIAELDRSLPAWTRQP